MVFHICGDTGGVKNPGPQQLVASAMEADAMNTTADGEAAFFYHLGDVVYYKRRDERILSAVLFAL